MSNRDFLIGGLQMFHTFKKILEQDKEKQEKERKKAQKEYFFAKEWELLKAQRERENNGGKDD
jgi:hypothetical protein